MTTNGEDFVKTAAGSFLGISQGRHGLGRKLGRAGGWNGGGVKPAVTHHDRPQAPHQTVRYCIDQLLSQSRDVE